jgi:hypothetical protein
MISEKIILSGHIIDSLILPKVLDEIIELGGDFCTDLSEFIKAGGSAKCLTFSI